VRDGRADVMLAGGAEAPLAPLTFAAFQHHPGDEHAERRSRPRLPAVRREPRRLRSWARERAVPSSRSAAEPWRAAPGSTLKSWATAYTNDAYHMTAPRPDGRQAARAIQLALADGDVTPGDVGYINAHGSFHAAQ